MELQLGLYALALEQTYGQSLKYVSLLFLRSGEKVRYATTDRHKRQVMRVLKDLAWQVRHDAVWDAKPGNQCQGCSYSQYCTAVNKSAQPEPRGTKIPSLQLAFSLWVYFLITILRGCLRSLFVGITRHDPPKSPLIWGTKSWILVRPYLRVEFWFSLFFGVACLEGVGARGIGFQSS